MADDLLFLTGLSIDKKSLNTTYSNIVNDIMYQEFLEDIKELCLSIPRPNLVKDSASEIAEGNAIAECYGAVKEFAIENSLPDILLAIIELDITSVISGKLTSSLLGMGINYIAHKTNRTVYEGSPFSEVFIKALVENEKIRKRIGELQSLDFFKVYLSNQSDSRGVPAIAKMITTLPNLTTHWGYSDRPFYQNEFIDSLNITIVNKKLLENSTLELLQVQYMLHGVDIVLSHIIEEIDSGKVSDSKESAYRDVVENVSSQFMKEFGKSISERCFFGIDLLSRVFLTLYHQKSGLDGIGGQEKTASKLKIKIQEDGDCYKSEFIKELVECSGDPLCTEIVDDNNCDILISLSDRESLIASKKKTSVAAKIVAKKGRKIIANYFPSTDSLIVPVKLFLSLPLLMKNGLPDKPSHKALMPQLMTTSSDDIVDVFTSGGIEHNRPLMHLINAHRLQQKEKRVFGFIDNQFDFIHRWENHGKEDFEHLFIMGVAQPVSGFNQVLLKRFDNPEGLSSSKEAKQILFSVECPVSRKTFITLSSYGFSALASVYATLRTIARLLDTNSGNKSRSLLERTAPVLQGARMDIKSGYSWRVIFSDRTEERMYKASNGIDPFSVITSVNYPDESRQLVEIFLENEKNGGVIHHIHSAQAVTK